MPKLRLNSYALISLSQRLGRTIPQIPAEYIEPLSDHATWALNVRATPRTTSRQLRHRYSALHEAQAAERGPVA